MLNLKTLWNNSVMGGKLFWIILPSTLKRVS